MVCKFYLQGTCSYGDNCRYDHVRPSHAKAIPSSRAPESMTFRTTPQPEPDDDEGIRRLEKLLACTSLTAEAGHSVADTKRPAWTAGLNLPDNMDDLGISAVDEDSQWSSHIAITDPAELPICSHFAAFGWCAKGEECHKIHGDECCVCYKNILHPYRPEEAAEHIAQCQIRKQRAEAHLRSAEVECAICLEKVLSKPTVSERKFGLMACEHAFCLGCIRNWRTQYVGVDVETALRTCPICRTTTHFITPSSVWPSTPEEKDGIVEGYKTKLSAIDCRHFNRGNGTCPFGTSCFYRHMLPDGTLDEPALRHYGNADGEVSVVKPVLLSHFMDLPGTRSAQLLGRR